MPDGNALQNCQNRFGRRAFWAVGWMAVVAAQGVFAAEPAPKPSVKLVINYNDGVEKHFTALPWKEGMTVLDAMQLAKAHVRGIRFETTGSKATLFVSSLDGIKNQGGTGEEKNWIFSVNDKKGNKSCAVVELKPSDVVEWKFDQFEF